MARKTAQSQTLGQRLRAARQAAGLTQAALAERIGDGLTQSYVARLEADQHQATVPMLRRLAAVLKTTASELIA